MSGATTKSPPLLRCLKGLQDGDTLIVWKLGRLASSLRDLIAMGNYFTARNAKLRRRPDQAIRSWRTLPATSVSRKSRPL
jgi:DNA invertase Pin-like site-specific DNA recombinase